MAEQDNLFVRDKLVSISKPTFKKTDRIHKFYLKFDRK